MNGNLLLEDHAERIVMIGKNPIIANTASKPTSTSSTTHPGATGINAAAFVALIPVAPGWVVASKPTSTSATTHPGATGINATNAAAVATNIIGAAQKIGLSALAGIIISFEISLSPSPINCNIPSTFPQ